MNIVKVFASILLIAGMALLVFSCLAFMQGTGSLFGIDVNRLGVMAPTLLGIMFFAGGLFLFKFMMKS